METLITIILIIFFLVFICILLTILFSLRTIPFVPTNRKEFAAMIKLAHIKPGNKAVDLGSGDGRIVVEFARQGLEAHGYEINPFLVVWSRLWIRLCGLSDKAHIHYKNFWDVSLSEYDIVTIYGLPRVMQPLEKKLSSELKKNSRVICNTFQFRHWKATDAIGNQYLYIKN